MEIIKSICCIEGGGFTIRHYKTSDDIDVITAIIHNKHMMNDKMLEDLCEVMVEEFSGESLTLSTNNTLLLIN